MSIMRTTSAVPDGTVMPMLPAVEVGMLVAGRVDSPPELPVELDVVELLGAFPVLATGAGADVVARPEEYVGGCGAGAGATAGAGELATTLESPPGTMVRLCTSARA